MEQKKKPNLAYPSGKKVLSTLTHIHFQRIQGHKSQLEATLSNMSDNEEILVDELVTVSCPLFRQLLNAYSEDAATDDYIYYLGEALRQVQADE